MGYLSDVLVSTLLTQIVLLPDVEVAISSWQKAWGAEGLPREDVDVGFVGAVFFDEGLEEPLLPEARRLRAADPKLFQLVYLSPVLAGLDVETFDDLASAGAKLDTLGADETGEGGGVVFHGGKAVAEKLALKYMRKADFEDFLRRAAAPPRAAAPIEEGGPEQVRVVKDALLERLRKLTELAPKMGELKRQYEAKGLTEPEVIYGKPSEALIEFAQRFPHLIRLGGCFPPNG